MKRKKGRKEERKRRREEAIEGCQEMNMVCINNFRNMRIEENRLKGKRREGKRRGIVGKKA